MRPRFFPSDDGLASGGADRGRGERISKHDAVTGNLVEVWRVRDLVASVRELRGQVCV